MGNIFAMTALTFCFYSIAMNGSSIILTSFGPSTVLFVIIAIVFNFTVEWILIGVCLAIMLGYLARLAIAYCLIKCNESF